MKDRKYKVGDKLKLTLSFGLHRSNDRIRKYKAVIIKVTGVAVQVKYRSRRGVHHQWLNKALEKNGYPYWSFSGETLD